MCSVIPPKYVNTWDCCGKYGKQKMSYSSFYNYYTVSEMAPWYARLWTKPKLKEIGISSTSYSSRRHVVISVTWLYTLMKWKSYPRWRERYAGARKLMRILPRPLRVWSSELSAVYILCPPTLHSFYRFSSPEIEIRALVEGQMLHHRAVAESMGFLFGDDAKIIATGGASVNTSILQVIADVFNAPVYLQVSLKLHSYHMEK